MLSVDCGFWLADNWLYAHLTFDVTSVVYFTFDVTDDVTMVIAAALTVTL